MKRQLSNVSEKLPKLPASKRAKKNEEEVVILKGTHSKETEEKEKIILERKTNNEEKLKKFLEFCKPLILKMGVTSGDWTQISNNLMNGYHVANRTYAMSEEFVHLISDTKRTIKAKCQSVMTELLTVAKELTAYKVRKPKKHKRHKFAESEHSKSNQGISDVPIEGNTDCSTDHMSEKHKDFNDNGMNKINSDLETEVVKQTKSQYVNRTVPVSTETSNFTSLNKQLNTCSETNNSSVITSSDQVCKPSTTANSLHTSPSSEDSFLTTSLYLASTSSTCTSLNFIRPHGLSSHNHDSKSPTYNDEVCEASNANSHASDDVMLMSSKEHKVNAKKKKRIRELEKLLGKIDQKVKKLQQRELSFDDLDDDQSSYVIEAKLKNQFMKIWNILCDLKQRSIRVGREIDRPIVYRATRYDAVNKAVEKFVNKKKVFPDFPDICDIVKKVHNESDLGLESFARIELAREIFEDIGAQLKHRRLKDYHQLIGCSLTDNPEIENDPADQDEDLQKVLEENAAAASKKLNEILQKYTFQQMKLKDGIDKADSSDSNNENSCNELNEDDLPETEPVTSSSEGKL